MGSRKYMKGKGNAWRGGEFQNGKNGLECERLRKDQGVGHAFQPDLIFEHGGNDRKRMHNLMKMVNVLQ